MGNAYRYTQATVFDTFPFPNATENQKQAIRAIAEKLDNHRKTRQAAYPRLTLTDMYNVLEKVQNGQELTVKEQMIFEQANIVELRKLHDALDEAVAKAYGVNNKNITKDETLKMLLSINNNILK